MKSIVQYSPTFWFGGAQEYTLELNETNLKLSNGKAVIFDVPKAQVQKAKVSRANGAYMIFTINDTKYRMIFYNISDFSAVAAVGVIGELMGGVTGNVSGTLAAGAEVGILWNGLSAVKAWVEVLKPLVPVDVPRLTGKKQFLVMVIAPIVIVIFGFFIIVGIVGATHLK